jgi:hypothetical protein
MGYSPFLRSVCFWGSFYVFYNYSSRDPISKRQRYPSYLIFKEKIIRDTWRDGFNCDKLQTEFGHYSRELWSELKSIAN